MIEFDFNKIQSISIILLWCDNDSALATKQPLYRLTITRRTNNDKHGNKWISILSETLDLVTL